MKKIPLVLSLISISIFMFGCDPDNNYLSLDEFKSQVNVDAGSESYDCGQVEKNESPENVNKCVKEKFLNSETFYATYVHQGIDSTPATAISMGADGVLKIWRYDSATGGNVLNKTSRVGHDTCDNPYIPENEDLDETIIFQCSNS